MALFEIDNRNNKTPRVLSTEGGSNDSVQLYIVSHAEKSQLYIISYAEKSWNLTL